MHKIEANEIVWTTFYTINRLIKEKNWENALALYFAYLEQSRIQETNQSWSLDIFMKKKLWRGSTKLSNAKAVLKKLWLIDIIQVRDKKGKIQTVYIKTNFIINEEKIRTKNIVYTSEVLPPKSQYPCNGKQATNALSTKHKCLNNKKEINNIDYKKELEWLINDWHNITIKNKQIKQFKRLPKIRKVNDNFKKTFIKKRKEYSMAEIREWLNNYLRDIENRKYNQDWSYFNHIFTLHTFLKQSNWLDKYINF